MPLSYLGLSNLNGRRQFLAVRLRFVNLVDDLHPAHHFAESGESLAIRITFAAEIELRLIANADEEIDGELLWDDLLALVDRKDRRVVVCLRNGLTRVSEIAQVLGYANHSAVSKKLSRIRIRARALLS